MCVRAFSARRDRLDQMGEVVALRMEEIALSLVDLIVRRCREHTRFLLGATVAKTAKGSYFHRLGISSTGVSYLGSKMRTWTAQRGNRSRRRWVIRLSLAVSGLWLLVEVLLWPNVSALAASVPDRTAFMQRYEARHGRSVVVTWTPYDEIADTLKRAVLVAEDIDFFSHDGFAFDQARLAIQDAIRDRKLPRGASTLTQQLAKNLWLSPSRSPRRKIREALLTRALERELEKRRILEIYLNVVEFGDATFGCEAASRRFFDKPAARLTDHEAARLAAVLPRPGQWSPLGREPAFLAAVERIERRSARAQWLHQVI